MTTKQSTLQTTNKFTLIRLKAFSEKVWYTADEKHAV